MLRFAEEIVLLILDDGGEIARVPGWPLHCALAGGLDPMLRAVSRPVEDGASPRAETAG